MQKTVPAIQFLDTEPDLYKIFQPIQYQDKLFISAHIADIHFPKNNIGPETQYRILYEQFVLKISNLPRLDCIFVNGDLFDHKVLASSDAAYYASLFISNLVDICRRKNSTLILLHGTLSHDANQLKLYNHYMHDPTIDVRIINQLSIEYIKEARVLCIPELYGISDDIYNQYLYGKGYYDLCVIHGTYDGAVYQNNVGQGRCFYIEDFMCCNGPIIGGHVHKPDCFDKSFYYCGSPYASGFDDDHDKSYILLLQNLNTRQYYLYRDNIKSFIYRTFDIDTLKSNDPKDTIRYIEELKEKYKIDYIRIRINAPLDGSNKMILSSYFRNNDKYKIEFTSVEDQLVKQQYDKIQNELIGYEFLMDKNLSDEAIFVEYVNKLKGEQYITIEDLTRLLSS